MHEGSANTHSRTMAADAKLQKCMRRARGLQQRMQQEQEQQQEPSRPQGLTSEQPGPVQVLLTDNQEEVFETNQDSVLGPTSPRHMKSPSSCTDSPYQPSSRPSLNLRPTSSQPQPQELHESSNWSTQNEDEWGGIRLSDVLQASGIRIMPIRKHLAISLPSLPLDFWGVLGEDEEVSSFQHSQSPNPPLWQGTTDSPDRILQSSNPSPPPNPVEEKGPVPQRAPIWQTLHASSKPCTKLTPPVAASHWSSWGLDHLDAIVNPYDTPPEQTPGRHLAPRSPMSTRKKNIPKYSKFQSMELEPTEAEDQELSELDSLYQASLQAGPGPGRALRGTSSPALARPVPPTARKLLTGVGRSRTPTAELERTAYGPPGCCSPTGYMNMPLSLAHQEHQSVEEDQYDVDHLRRIARSLSGTVIGRRQNRLAVSRSFDVSRGSPSFWLCLTGVKLSPVGSTTVQQ